MSRRIPRSCLQIVTLAALSCAFSACGDDAESPTPTPDAGRTLDAGHEAGAPESGADMFDASTDASDASLLDAAPDASDEEDAGSDAGACGAALPEDAGTYVPPTTLADTGLYADFASETLADGVLEFEPRFALWSDGATKKRYLYLPPCTQIDTSDMDSWVFPVGTKAWKEFTRGGVRVETRLLEKTAFGWYMVAFIWNTAQTEATAAELGMNDANGTLHDVPPSATCRSCHDGMADKLLGVGAIQLSHQNTGLNLDVLETRALLSHPPANDFKLPGTITDQTALGAMHANCGHCHNPLGGGWSTAKNMQLRLLTGSLASVNVTPAYATTVGKALEGSSVPGSTQRIVAGDADTSGLVLRLEATRGTGLAMPPLATELPDDDTASAVRTWVESLVP